MRIISIANQKGGTGKTTSAINIGHGLFKLGKKVLLVDLDPQAHLTYSLGIQAHELKKTIYELLKGDIKFNQALIDRKGLKLIPSTLDLSSADMEFSNIAGREFLLSESLKDVFNYDFILIDTPPSLSILTLNAFTYSKEIFIPLQMEYLTLRGLKKLVDTIDLVKKRLNSKLKITGIIGTFFDNRKRLNQEVLKKVQNYFKTKVFNTLIRSNISLAEAPSFGKSIFEYKIKSNGAIDYMKLCQEIIKGS